MTLSQGQNFPNICMGCSGTNNLEVHDLSLSHRKDEWGRRMFYSVRGKAYLCTTCKEKSKKNRKIFLIIGPALILLGILSWVYLVDNVNIHFIEIGPVFFLVGAFFLYKGAMLVTLTSNYVKFVGVKKDKNMNTWEPKLNFSNNTYKMEYEKLNSYGYIDNSITPSSDFDNKVDNGWN
jgi:hypothetical protein